MTPTASLLLGALLGAANAGAAVWTVKAAAGLAPDRGTHLILGGMTVRMLLVLAAFALVIATVPVHRIAFVGGLGLLFVAGLAAEVALVLGRSDRSRPPADA